MTKKPPYSRKVGSQSEVPLTNIDSNNILSVNGYQEYQLNQTSFQSLKTIHEYKYQIIRPYLLSSFRNDKILDVGCSAGVIGLQAIVDSCPDVHFLDHDPEYLEVVQIALKHLNHNASQVSCSSISKFSLEYDVGIALAIIHWIYSYSEKAGSLKQAIEMLHRICPKALFIEWVSPNDSAIIQANHIRQNKSEQIEPYNYKNFMAALNEFYPYTKKIGKTSSTRELWLASSSPIVVDETLLTESEARLQKLAPPVSISNKLRRFIHKVIK